MLGLAISWSINVPCGPAIVILLGIGLILAATLKGLISGGAERAAADS